MTGRGLGYCAGYSTPGYTKGVGRGFGRGFGRGWGRGRGRGRGYGRGFYAPYYAPTVVPAPAYERPVSPQYSQENQLDMLKQEKQYLESEMEGIKKALGDISDRISELEQENMK
jgi:hypothetical protein